MSWLGQYFEKTTKAIQGGFYTLVGDDKKISLENRKIIEETLILADLGPKVSGQIVDDLLKKLPKKVDLAAFRKALAGELIAILTATKQHKKDDFSLFEKPSKKALRVIVLLGVNGSGKTTTAGKIAHLMSARGEKLVMAACDTYRAAAVEQLQSWGDKSGVLVVRGANGVDSSSVAYEAMETALEQQADWLLVDTAGRLHNNTNLMAELAKIVRVLRKQNATIPIYNLLVIDAGTGQNAKLQAREFDKTVKLDGLVLTKLDGTAKAGIVVPLVEEMRVPITAIGVGEKLENLLAFDEEAFVNAIMEL